MATLCHPSLGLGFMPQERGIFASLTARENLTVAARRGERGLWTLDKVFELFPRLKERVGLRGSKLSGGEQQMLSIARALLLNPSLLVLDEPSEGPAPLIVQEVIRTLQDLRKSGPSILIVKQNVQAALSLADRHFVLSKGQVCFAGTTEQLKRNEAVIRRNLGL
jgi:branched-chain amino acid transport system ATP-binding protein